MKTIGSFTIYNNVLKFSIRKSVLELLSPGLNSTSYYAVYLPMWLQIQSYFLNPINSQLIQK